MGRPLRALRYAALDDALMMESGADEAWSVGHAGVFGAGVAECLRMSDEQDETALDLQAAERRGEAARAPRGARRDGSKTAAKLETRIKRRAERLALDQLRHQELLDNQQQRQARTLSRRWFVLGRALDAHWQANPEAIAALRAALRPHILRADELALLGWDDADGP